jgi:hypothetical protein
MKKKDYIKPETTEEILCFDVHLMAGSPTEDHTYGGDSDAKEQTFDDWDDVTMNRPRNINLWEE